MDKTLPARPHLDHLRGQAKELRAAKKWKLAEAQTAVARQHGFASWTKLVRHVELLRSLEGEWRFAHLEIDGNVMPPAITAAPRILIDGDRFRTESPEGTYEGIFTIDADHSPTHFDLKFVEGPEAGQTSYGIIKVDGPDRITLCLGLVHSSRPETFATRHGGGHALEHLERTSQARPDNVTGGTPQPIEHPSPSDANEPESAFDLPLTPMHERLQGVWAAVELVTDGKPMPEAWLAHGSRTMRGNELEVVFGGQKMVHAKVRIDAGVTPIAVDYYSLLGKQRGTITYGIMEWVGADARFLMAPIGAARPADFGERKGTLSRWRVPPSRAK